ncbi:MAG TPA: tRNA (N6-isopentenyl adenosine(37)-C2)-methylthiotransferase MiaB, partial [Stenotrophomonas sp.]
MPGTPAPEILATPVVDVPAPAPGLVPLPSIRPAIPGGARGKLYIKTHGC